jgi:hypothetical protein
MLDQGTAQHEINQAHALRHTRRSPVILVRSTFRVKFGRMKDALALMKEGEKAMTAISQKRQRLLTDVTGEFYTLVLETEYESLAEFEKLGAEMMRAPAWRDWYQKFGALVDSGRRDIYAIVA